MKNISNTETVKKIISMGGEIFTRDSNEHVCFFFNGGRKYEITPKNNRDYQLNQLNAFTGELQTEIGLNSDPSMLLQLL